MSKIIKSTIKKQFFGGLAILSIGGGIGITAESVLAQSQLPNCQPPQTGEYLVLVSTPTSATQEQLRRTVPAEQSLTVCQYQNNIVSRIGGFPQLDDAQKWSSYIRDIVGLSAVVVQANPSQTTTATTSTNSSTTTSANYPPYNPRPLGNGYAVLIDYFNQPEIAAQARQVLGKDVGLASYFARPYLLALYTANQRDAQSALQRLSERGFWVMVVDSRKVTLLTQVVRY